MMDWIKKHYDLAILVASTFILVANAALIFTKTQSEDASLATTATAADKNALQEFQATILDKAKSAATNPTVWQFTDRDPSIGSLLVSRKYLLKDGKLFDPIEGGENLHDPITNAWLIKHDLDYTDEDIKDGDPDGDGFTNLEEFEDDTNPNDRASKPPIYKKLELTKFESLKFPFEFRFAKYNEFHLNNNGKTIIKKLGDTLRNEPYEYKLVDYQPKFQSNDDDKRQLLRDKDLNYYRFEEKNGGYFIKNQINGELIQVVADPEDIYILHNSEKKPIAEFEEDQKIKFTNFVFLKVHDPVPELTLENTITKTTIVLVLENPAYDPRSLGTFKIKKPYGPYKLTSGEENGVSLDLRIGDTFKIKPDQIEFKIIDITADSAQIEDTTTERTYRISKAENSNTK